MAQSATSVANGSGGTVRAAINSLFLAVLTQYSGNAFPASPVNNMWCFREDLNILYVRTEDNTAWVPAFAFSGTNWVPYSNGAVLGTLANQNASAINVDLIMSGKALKGAQATVASASNVDLTNAGGNSIVLTGTTTIQSCSIAAGEFFLIRYTGAGLTLVHGSPLDLPTGANIALATGDALIVMGTGANTAKVVAVMRASGAALVGATSAANQAQMEAASNNTAFATAGTVGFHPGVAKSWCEFDQIGTHDVAASLNVAALTDNGVGLTTVTFATAFSSANYAWSAQARNNTDASTQSATVDLRNTGTKTASALQVRTTQQIADSSGAGQMASLDSANVSVLAFGDL
jgi:hypothetical protein